MSTITMDQTFDQMFHSPSAVRPRSTVRLTRRGRVVVVLFALVAVIAVGIMVAAGSVATGQGGTPEPTAVVQVGPGDTLWGIASETAEPGHVREMVHQIQELNALSGAGLQVGQEIAVPLR